MRVLISGGGTGGHVYPALAVAAQLREAHPQAARVAAGAEQPSDAPRAPAHEPNDVALLWIGSTGGMEQALVEREGIAYRGVEAGQLNGVHPVRALLNAGRLSLGARQSLDEVRRFRPDVCLATGGYVCAPVIAACRTRRVPVLIYLPDMTPGWSIRWMSRLAQRVAVTFADAAQAFGGEAPLGKAVVTGYPVRQALLEVAGRRGEARAALARVLDRPLGETGEIPLILVFGGSQGSRSINQATWGALPQILPSAYVLHLIGTRDWKMHQEQQRMQPLSDAVATDLAERYVALPYLHEEMVLALTGADLAVARAGASTLGEFPVAQLPSILAPLPFGGVGQQRNAAELAKQGAALVIADEALSTSLAGTIVELLSDPVRLATMQAAAARLAQPDAAARIVEELERLAHPAGSIDPKRSR